MGLQWDEVSGLDDESNSVRTYEICTPNSPASYWLRTRWIPRKLATTLYVEIWSAYMNTFKKCLPTCLVSHDLMVLLYCPR